MPTSTAERAPAQPALAIIGSDEVAAVALAAARLGPARFAAAARSHSEALALRGGAANAQLSRLFREVAEEMERCR
jgi:hypothetical protein